MKTSLHSYIPWVTAAIIGCIPFLLGNQFRTVSRTEEEGLLPAYSCVEVPARYMFCDSVVDLTRYDRRERMDRELLAFSYMHSTSLQIIKRANRYFPVVEPILKQHNVPDDFKYLMVIESNLNPLARSGAGAAGMWQFMPGTARDYGLEVSNTVDERYHLEKATHAACEYLKDAYRKYGNWLNVVSSYNAGQARISRQLLKQDVDDVLDLYLVEETTRYPYRVLAAKMMLENPLKFGFRLRASDLYPPIHFREVKVSKDIVDLARFAQGQGIHYSLLKSMNPWLRSTSLDARAGKIYTLKIPDKESMYYNPKVLIPYNKNWVTE